MSVYVASALKYSVPILLPENGTIALNHPLTPSRYSTCSTRTAHPHMVNELKRLLNKLNLPANIHNAYEFKTKGDMVADCKNIDVFKRGYLNTCSCAKRGTRKDIRENPSAKNCGVCMPCMYRRAALHRMALDVEPIGTNMLDPDDQVRSLLKIPDMPAFLSFLKTNLTKSDIEGNLLCNGSLPLDLIGDYADVVVGVRKEIMRWIIDKGGIAIKKELGL